MKDEDQKALAKNKANHWTRKNRLRKPSSFLTADVSWELDARQNCARPARTSPLARPSQANLRNNAADPVLRHCAVAGSGLFRSRPLAGRATSADKRPPRAR